MRVLAAAALLASATACKFPFPADVPDGDASPTDAQDTDSATVACEADTITCDDARGVYVECSPTGTVTRSLDCPLGCAPDEEKCLDIDPHNGLAMYLDMVPDPPDVHLAGPVVITDSGALLDAGEGVAVPTFVADSGGLATRVFVVRNFVLEGNLTFPTVHVDRRRAAIAIVASGTIDIRARIDISAHGTTPGPGGYASNSSDQSSCGGHDVFAAPPTASRGGGGAGGFTAGGGGGEVSGTSTTPGGPARTSSAFLDGGCNGGSVFNNIDTTVVALGGSGGGALQLASRTRIQLTGSALIDASGEGGRPALRMGGGGGGAGGVVLLEAPQVVLDGPSVVISTKGGGGAGGSGASLGSAGAAGGTGAAGATGGTSPVGATGGRGGGSSPPAPGDFYMSSTGGGGGGGGGAAGVTYTFTTAGEIAPQNGAAIRGPLVSERLRTRKIP